MLESFGMDWVMDLVSGMKLLNLLQFASSFHALHLQFLSLGLFPGNVLTMIMDFGYSGLLLYF